MKIQIKNELSPENPNISWAAKGLFFHLKFHRENSDLNISKLTKSYTGTQRGNGRNAIKKLLVELKFAGFINY